VIRHPRGIGQYTLGHADRLERIRRVLGELPGLTVTGSSYLGVSLNSCIKQAGLEAESIAKRIATFQSGARTAV
jgi:oxygen-dependent protoporphyrinogen oxidase